MNLTGHAVWWGLGLLAVLALLAAWFWPRIGLRAQRVALDALRARMRAEDALKHVHKSRAEGRWPTLQSLAGAAGVDLDGASEIVAQLQKGGLLQLEEGEMRLTESGNSYALQVIRAHRLWEQHLAEQTGVAESDWHRRAERAEHFITPQQAETLAAGLGHPTHDPHGDPIPDAHGGFIDRGSQSLTHLPAGSWGRVTHIEDEPERVYDQIRAAGIYPGLTFRLLDRSPQELRLWWDGVEHCLPSLAASAIAVTVEDEPRPAAGKPCRLLSQLRPGERAKVLRLSPQCRGAERRRMMDLGILPGTVLASELQSPTGNLTAFRVKEALIALREEQAAHIQVEAVEPAAK